MNQKSIEKHIDGNAFRWLIGIFFIFALILWLPTFLTNLLSQFDFKWASEFGSAFSGITAPFIALISILVTFLAFYMQVQANRQIQFQFDVQTIDNKIAELLATHREYLNNYSIRSPIQGHYWTGSRCSFLMTEELKIINKIVTNYCPSLNQRNKSDFIFRILFFGIKETVYSTDPVLLNDDGVFINRVIDPKSIVEINSCLNVLKEIQLEYHLLLHNTKRIKGFTQYGTIVLRAHAKRSLLGHLNEFHYYPFYGHMSRLQHTHRYLYQICEFINQIDETRLPKQMKLERLMTIGYQLTKYDQILLFMNALSFGSAWFEKKHVFNCCLCYHIPNTDEYGYSDPSNLPEVQEYIAKSNANNKKPFGFQNESNY